MITEPQIATQEPMTIAKLHQVVPRDQIREIMGKTLQELSAAIAAQGLIITGPWFTHHLRRPEETFDFEACFPVSQPIQATGRIAPGEWPSMAVARTVYTGGYEGLGAAWGEFIKWIDDNGHTVAEDLWERYLVGPESGKNPSEWQTELNRPLIGKP